jgi:type II secretory pathway pseudopilin PulG
VGKGSERKSGAASRDGFTTIELVIVIVTIGVLVVAVGYKLTSFADTTGRVAVDQVKADIQYVQVLAMSDLTLSSGTKSISFTSGSNTYSMAGQTRTLPGGATAGTTATLTFNSLGELTTTSDVTIAVGDRAITVTGITGKVSG